METLFGFDIKIVEEFGIIKVMSVINVIKIILKEEYVVYVERIKLIKIIGIGNMVKRESGTKNLIYVYNVMIDATQIVVMAR